MTIERAWPLLAAGCLLLAACTSDPRFEVATTEPSQTVDKSDPCYDPNDKAALDDRYQKDKASIDSHLLVVNSIGDAQTGSDEGVHDKFVPQLHRIADAYAKWAANVPESRRRVVIYVNGGLNTLGEVRRQAAVQIPCMESDSSIGDYRIFPIFLVWRTGPFETYAEQNNRVRDGILAPHMLPTAPIYYATDVARGIIRAPLTLWDHTQAFVKAFRAQDNSNYHVRVFQDALKDAKSEQDRAKRKIAYAPFQRYDGVHAVAKDNNVLYYPADTADGNIDSEIPTSFQYYLNYGATTPLRIISTPFVDSLGETAWENMVRRSRMTIRTAWEFQQDLFDPTDSRALKKESESTSNGPSDDAEASRERDELIARYPNGTGAFSRFFQSLQWCVATDGKLKGDDKAAAECERNDGALRKLASAKFTLIGHSMGTIVLSDLIFLYPKLDYADIVYMAAAASIRHVRATVVPLLEDRAGKTHFYSLMLHPVAEVREVTWGGSVLSGSLLEWVDDMYENPKTIPDRTFGKWRNILATKSFFPETAQRWMVFKVFGFRRFDAQHNPVAVPIRHGEFNDTVMRYWRPGFWGAEGDETLCWTSASCAQRAGAGR